MELHRQPARPLVALSACADYGPSLEGSIRAALAHLGGMRAFVRAGQRVLIKPNLLSDREPAQAVTTHPEVVRALIRMVRQAGGRPAVGDSPASVVKLERVWAKTGLGAVCAGEGVPLLNFEQAGSVAFAHDGYRFSIARPVLEADVIINVPKIKTHVLTTLTAAVKNMYGAVPGYQKTQLHRDYPRASDFVRLLARVYAAARPHLTVADGVVGMDGNGPSAGTPLRLGFLAASDDAVALDKTLCRVLGIDPCAVAYLARLANGTPEGRIEVRGESVAGLKPTRFRLPGTLPALLIPRTVVRLLRPLLWIRPTFSARCVACGRCVTACPAGALALADGAPANAERNPADGCKGTETAGTRGGNMRRRPVLNRAACIGCCCCHEVCPENAVCMVLSPMLRLVRRGKPL